MYLVFSISNSSKRSNFLFCSEIFFVDQFQLISCVRTQFSSFLSMKISWSMCIIRIIARLLHSFQSHWLIKFWRLITMSSFCDLSMNKLSYKRSIRQWNAQDTLSHQMLYCKWSNRSAIFEKIQSLSLTMFVESDDAFWKSHTYHIKRFSKHLLVSLQSH
jgi:hypothetical protein